MEHLFDFSALFWCNIRFVAIYTLLCGAQINPKILSVCGGKIRNMMKEHMCAFSIVWFWWLHLFHFSIVCFSWPSDFWRNVAPPPVEDDDHDNDGDNDNGDYEDDNGDYKDDDDFEDVNGDYEDDDDNDDEDEDDDEEDSPAAWLPSYWPCSETQAGLEHRQIQPGEKTSIGKSNPFYGNYCWNWPSLQL